MSLDRSLKSKTSLVRHRNVLTRAERIAKLRDLDRWVEGTGPFGLPKVVNRKATVGKKAKTKAKAEGDEEGAAPAGEEAKAAAK